MQGAGFEPFIEARHGQWSNTFQDLILTPDPGRLEAFTLIIPEARMPEISRLLRDCTAPIRITGCGGCQGTASRFWSTIPRPTVAAQSTGPAIGGTSMA